MTPLPYRVRCCAGGWGFKEVFIVFHTCMNTAFVWFISVAGTPRYPCTARSTNIQEQVLRVHYHVVRITAFRLKDCGQRIVPVPFSPSREIYNRFHCRALNAYEIERYKIVTYQSLWAYCSRSALVDIRFLVRLHMWPRRERGASRNYIVIVNRPRYVRRSLRTTVFPYLRSGRFKFCTAGKLWDEQFLFLSLRWPSVRVHSPERSRLRHRSEHRLDVCQVESTLWITGVVGVWCRRFS